MEELRHVLGERLAAARKSAGLSQGELAERTGTRNWMVSRYETGRNCPSLPMLCTLSRVLQTSTDYLLGIEPEPREPGSKPQRGRP